MPRSLVRHWAIWSFIRHSDFVIRHMNPRLPAREVLNFPHDSTLFAGGNAGNLERTAQAGNLAPDRTARQRGLVRPGPGPEKGLCPNEGQGRVLAGTLQGA